MTIGICTYVTYVLKLECGCYYVGKSKSLNKRLNAHFSGDGAKWTQIYKPIKVVEIKENDVEEQTTIEYMHKYGTDLVRGFTWCQTAPLSKYQKFTIKTKIRSL
jgi:predicted GIY-YIG superfamily endonuclease